MIMIVRFKKNSLDLFYTYIQVNNEVFLVNLKTIQWKLENI